MKVLVTGANGFLGRHVVRSLQQDGHHVVALVRSAVAAASFEEHPSLEVRQADLRVSPLAEALTGVEVVVHCAAQVTGSDEARFGSTVVGTERLLAAIEQSSVSQLVLVSSYSVYDWDEATEVLDEQSPVLARPYRRDGYTVAKVWQERIVSEFAARSGVDVTILRPGFVWGPGNEELAGAGIRVGSLFLVVGPATKLPVTYVSNCADAVAAAVARRPPSGTVLNIVDGGGVSAWRYAGSLVAWDPALTRRVPVPYTLFNAFVTLMALVLPRIFRHGGKLPGVFMEAPFHARFRPFEHGASKAAYTLGWRPRVSFAEAERLTFVTPVTASPTGDAS